MKQESQWVSHLLDSPLYQPLSSHEDIQDASMLISEAAHIDPNHSDPLAYPLWNVMELVYKKIDAGQEDTELRILERFAVTPPSSFPH